ncbi:type II toxin-antitoxin system RelE/ParE family toxin [Acidaminobacter hydrogenoformans]|uniref:Plasmid stabilization system protein ParE n=1 Tax=Acidaminobacter hydrogenoformans DSM 2784 TaxID=1120920 RepID=A0A1G5S2Y4_9FIRM|nr:type II toxin-antitoxin system RelE/ParE family toxin [Acidaminobacter hydrogenoformans]SCZ80210.1 Plasmid stabilization system protein ParE [Acidaminobacter hydrogenoformans DSM 2784]
MDKYDIKLLSKAIRDLDNIYTYIARELNNQEAALSIVDKIEETILTLETMPFRGAQRRVGAYAKKGYRQIFAKNFIVLYRVDPINKQIVVVAIRSMRSRL